MLFRVQFFVSIVDIFDNCVPIKREKNVFVTNILQSLPYFYSIEDVKNRVKPG